MKIRKLRLENIRSYKDHEVSFPEGSILLSGDIGSGKTSILLGIEYALFGLQPGQRGASLLKADQDSGKVTLEIEIEGRSVTIERSLKRSGKSITQDYSAITQDGNKTEMSVTELKTKILELLNYPPEFLKKTNLLYRYTVYSPQEEMRQIILEDSETRLNALRHVFGIDKYKKIKDNLSTLTLRLREDSKIINAEIKDLDEHKTELNSYVSLTDYLDEKIVEHQSLLTEKVESRKLAEKEVQNIQDKITEKQKFEKEIEKTNILLTTKVEQSSKEDVELRQLQAKIQSTPQDLSDEKTDFERLISDKKILAENFAKTEIEISSRLSSLEIRLKEDIEKRSRIFKIDLCPTCLQNVSENHKHNIINETESQVTAYKRELQSLVIELDKIKRLQSENKEQLSLLEKNKQEAEIKRVRYESLTLSKERIVLLEKNRETLSKDIEFLRNHILLLKQTLLQMSKFDALYRIKEKDLKQLFVEERKLEIKVAELRKEKELTLKEIDGLRKKISAKEERKKKLAYLQNLENWLSNDFSNLVSFTEKNLLIKIRQEFSKLFNSWFLILTSESFSAQLDENFTPIILQRGYELDYSFLSGGERTAVALSYRLALNQMINSIFSKIKTKDLIILDEPTDGFSEPQLEKMRDILAELNVGQVILVSHEQKMESFVDNVIKIKKDSGESVSQ